MTETSRLRRFGRGASRVFAKIGGVLSHRRRPFVVYLWAFFLPFLIIGVIWAIAGVVPFGKNMILAHDQWHQYYPFYLELRERVQSGGSLFHSWTMGMGTNYLPLFAYYLASPLNYVSFLLPDSLVLVYYTFAVLVRIGLAGLFCAYFLKKTFDRCELTVSVFGMMYALCAFVMGYYWNAIWLDTVALLPLVALGALSLLRDRRYVLYVTSLALSVFCSYYIGLFTCIFVLLVFIGWHIVNWDDLGGFFARLFRFAVFSLIAIGMTAILTIPAYLGLQSTSSAANKFPEANAMNMVKAEPEKVSEIGARLTQGELADLYTFFNKQPPAFSETRELRGEWVGFSDALDDLRLGYVSAFFQSFELPLEGTEYVLSNTADAVEPTSMDGLPNVFCGFATLVMALLYLLCKKVPLKERIVLVLLLLFFAASFMFRTLDYIWHGLHFPNQLPYRFSFLWSFVVIFMAFRAYTQLEYVRWQRLLFLLIPLGVVLYCVIHRAAGKGTVAVTCVSAGLVLLLLTLFTLRLIRKEHFALGLCFILFAEAIVGAGLGVDKIGVRSAEDYPYKKEGVLAAAASIQAREANQVGLWRAEVSTKHSLNDAALIGYNGVSVFSSAANAKVSQFLQSIGLAASVAGNRYSYQEADPFTNVLLGVKYLIDRSGRVNDPTYFKKLEEEPGKVLLLENKYYLPQGFLVREGALDYDPSDVSGLPFERLNQLFREMTGVEKPLFTQIPLTTTKDEGELNSLYSKSIKEEMKVTVTLPKSGHLCFFSKTSNGESLYCYHNDKYQYYYSDKYGYNRYMGSFAAGDRVTLRYRPSAGKTAYVTCGAALFDADVFAEGYARLSETRMTTTLLTDTRLEGTVTNAEEGLLYTSIPYDSGWTLTVDGQPEKITAVGNAMIAFHLDPGSHRIVLHYETPGYSVGMTVTIICLALYLALLLVALLMRFTTTPMVKVPMHLEDPRYGYPVEGTDEAFSGEAGGLPPYGPDGQPGDPGALPYDPNAPAQGFAPDGQPYDPDAPAQAFAPDGPAPQNEALFRPTAPLPAGLRPAGNLDGVASGFRPARDLRRTPDAAGLPAAEELPAPEVPAAAPAEAGSPDLAAPDAGAPAPEAAPETAPAAGLGSEAAALPPAFPASPSAAADPALQETRTVPGLVLPDLPPLEPEAEDVYSLAELDKLLHGEKD